MARRRWRRGGWPSRYRRRPGSGLAPRRAARGHVFMIGPGYPSGPGLSQTKGIGCWCVLGQGSGIADPAEVAYYAGFSPANAPRAELVRVAGTRWIAIGLKSGCLQGSEVGGGLGPIRGAPLDWMVSTRHRRVVARGRLWRCWSRPSWAVTKCYAAAGDVKGGGDYGRVDPHDGARGATAVMPLVVATLPER